MRRTAVLSLFVIGAYSAAAHEVRPAYLELREVAPNEFSVLWKLPARGEMNLSLAPEFSETMEATLPDVRQSGGATIKTWRTRTKGPLHGQTVTIRGLASTMTDVLMRVEFADGTTWTHRLTPAAPTAEVPERQTVWGVAGEYVTLGVEHILYGVDHLLFVLALLLITKGALRLVKTVTAFTAAHSITLALAALGVVHVPSPPVEAVIALSIVFVAAEIVHERRGRAGVTARAPWIVAFTFGLLHGFGFAGALTEIGLPQGQIAVALLFFNVGVEIGQLLFVAAALALLALLRKVWGAPPRWVELAPPYAIGSVAMFWVIQRVAAF
ncbi:MAG: HupE/UreJ family protein [Candidatus Hydrogenedentes bacterium]|nr:HupE/UreJ family protein [Candidatus Hydrogenedentota bacterium]